MLDVAADPNAIATPPKATYEEARGIALAMTRIAIDHHADRVLELAKQNICEIESVP